MDSIRRTPKRSLTTYSTKVSTPYNPNTKALTKAISIYLHHQIEDNILSDLKLDPESILFMFSEENYINNKPKEYTEEKKALLRAPPTIENIDDFLQSLYECGQFQPECCILSLIYINRLTTMTDLTLHPTTWRPLLVCSFLVAQKVWDDHYLANADFAYIYPFFTLSEVNKMEKLFLELIHYNVTCKQSLYTKYYFELRKLLHAETDFILKELEEDDGIALEQKSKKYKSSPGSLQELP